jgi:hypothetical protein
MNPMPTRSASLSDAAVDTLFAGSGERLLAAYLRNALHTIAPGAVAYWAEVLAGCLSHEAPIFAEDPLAAREYQSLLEALSIDAQALKGRD